MSRITKFELCLRCALIPALVGWSIEARAQATPIAPSPEAAAASTDEPLVMSPFKVDTSKDKGYKATNAISGTRLDSAIKDLPMPLEVITADFIRDTGAYNLRQSLKYSAGLTIQSQNDWTTSNPYSNPGGVNNPNGKTADKTDTTVKIRGFITDFSLRDGFRRQVTTDSVNIERIEVVRGPAALLYGIGNFGGVVNYLIKTPQPKRRGSVDATFGSFGMKRGEFDVNEGVVKTSWLGEVNMRLTGAVQKNGDFTQLYANEKSFIAPIVTIKPTPTTEITLDGEYGVQQQRGIGFQSLRARADLASTDATGGQERFERAGFVTFPGMDLRTMRWSGPDTFQKTHAGNFEAKLTQEITPKLNLLLAYDHSSVSFLTRDVKGNITNNVGPSSLWATVQPVVLDPARGDTDANFGAYPVPNSIIQYAWSDVLEGTRSDQSRVELNYKLDLFEAHRWAAIRSNFLVGLSTELDKKSNQTIGLDTQGGIFDYKSPADSSPFRFGVQGDGTPSRPIKPLSWNETNARESGSYAIYQGKFLDGKVTVLGGFRRDRNRVTTNGITYDYGTGDISGTTAVSGPRKTDDTKQIGISLSPIPEFSFYALTSEGLQPNFSGTRDLTGNPIDAIRAKNKEVGIKFDLWHGRISGTISKYKITRTGVPYENWWAPQTYYHKFDPNKPTVYDVAGFNPDFALDVNNNPKGFYTNNYAWNGDLTKVKLDPYGDAQGNPGAPINPAYVNDGLNPMRVTIQNAWAAAKATPGVVKYYVTDGNGKTTTTDEATFKAQYAADLQNGTGTFTAFEMLNASTPQGAAYLDAVINYTRQNGIVHQGTDDWPGWLYQTDANDPAETGINNTSMDSVSAAVPPGADLAALGSDEYSGYDAQLVLSPTDQWQILLSYSHNDHKIISLGSLPKYPYYTQDRWPIWLFPNGTFGLNGVYEKNVQYKDESDSSTYQFVGLIVPGERGDDTPRDEWSVWTDYKFDQVPVLKGLSMGGGVQYKTNREYTSGFTHDGSDLIKDSNGNPIILYTPKQWNVDAMARYEFMWQKRAAYVQVNVNNVLNDKSRYGFTYAPGRSVNVTLGTEF
jgi:iron complex outermembrane recepter protein